MTEPIDFVIGVHRNGVVVDERQIKALTEREALMTYAQALIEEGKIETLKINGVGGQYYVVGARPLNIIYKQFALGSPVSGLARKSGKYIESMAEVQLKIEVITSIVPKITRIVKGTDWLL